MSKIHIMLQGKGGVGKSFISAVIAQYKRAKEQTPLCIDTVPVNGTFHGYKGLDVVKLDIMEEDQIDQGKFDALVELIAANNGNDVVVDNGAASFIPLCHYLTSNKLAELLNNMGHELVIHTVVTGGQALQDTVNGFSHLVSQFPGPAFFAVWLNPYWGPVEHDKLGFEQFKAYSDNKDRVSAILKMPQLAELFRRDLSDMLQERLTFDEALQMPSLTIMTRQRLKIIQSNFFQLLDSAVVL